jgi:hypothetical protein
MPGLDKARRAGVTIKKQSRERAAARPGLENIPSEIHKKERVFFREGLLKIFFCLPQNKT